MGIKKTPAVLAIRTWSFILNIVTYVILPALVLLALINTSPGDNFIFNLIYFMGVVYIFGGFFVFGTKMWELADDHFMIYQMGRWSALSTNKRIFYKLSITKDFHREARDMPGFFYDMYMMNSVRTKTQVYQEGKWYYTFSFEYIIHKGKIDLYLSLPFKRKDMSLKTIKARYPEIKLTPVEDPLKDLPYEWKDNLGIWGHDHFYGTSYRLANDDLYPLRNPATFGGPGGPTFSPMSELLESLRDHDPETRIVLQYLFRPFPHDAKKESWAKLLKEEKTKAFKEGASFDVEAGKRSFTTDLVTTRQRNLFNDIENNINDLFFKSHLRMLVFYPKGKQYYGPVLEKIMKTYFGQISGVSNIIRKDWFTANDRPFYKFPIEFLEGIAAPIANYFYHPKENQYRTKIHWNGLKDRNVDSPADSSKVMLSAVSAAALFHFPSDLDISTEPEGLGAGQSINQTAEVNTPKTNKLDLLKEQREQKSVTQQPVNETNQIPSRLSDRNNYAIKK